MRYDHSFTDTLCRPNPATKPGPSGRSTRQWWSRESATKASVGEATTELPSLCSLSFSLPLLHRGTVYPYPIVETCAKAVSLIQHRDMSFLFSVPHCIRIFSCLNAEDGSSAHTVSYFDSIWAPGMLSSISFKLPVIIPSLLWLIDCISMRLPWLSRLCGRDTHDSPVKKISSETLFVLSRSMFREVSTQDRRRLRHSDG